MIGGVWEREEETRPLGRCRLDPRRVWGQDRPGEGSSGWVVISWSRVMGQAEMPVWECRGADLSGPRDVGMWSQLMGFSAE